MIDPINTVALALVANSLALTLSQLTKEMSRAPEETQLIMKELAEYKLVRVRELGEGEFLYAITAGGVKELEKTEKKGVSALL